MTTDPQQGSGQLPVPPLPPERQSTPALLVAEDWLLAAWVAVATPLLFRAQGGGGPFDGGAPLLGVLRLGAVLGALICLAARRPPDDARRSGSSVVARGAIGPLTGALLLVAISGCTALGVTSGPGLALVVAAVVVMIVVHVVVPPLGLGIRRALVTPIILVAGGLFWTFIAAVAGEPGSGSPAAAIGNPQTAVAAGGFLLAFSAVYYTMLVYAPRQIAEREGGFVTWVLRYLLFVAGVAAGLVWPRVFGG